MARITLKDESGNEMVVEVCSACGAVVSAREATKHKNWHGRLQA